LRTNVAPKLAPGDALLYFGDFDWSGGLIESNTRRVLEQVIGGLLNWERVALTEHQVDDHNLPRIIKRDRRYKDGKPHEAVETEALRQTVLIEIMATLRGNAAPRSLSGREADIDQAALGKPRRVTRGANARGQRDRQGRLDATLQRALAAKGRELFQRRRHSRLVCASPREMKTARKPGLRLEPGVETRWRRAAPAL
jgi:hypothetical protein